MMFAEAAETADVVEAQLDRNAPHVERVGEKLRRLDPRTIVTCARGSSDHAATYAKYLIESRSGRFTTSAAPSIHSVYKRDMRFSDSVCIAVSQSGASPDLLSVAAAAKKGGAFLIAIVNVEESPLAQLAHEVLPLRAGDELSVAATKSFVASLCASAHLVAAWQKDAELTSALREAPNLLRKAWRCDWTNAHDLLSDCKSLFVLGRGIGLGVAQEAALKFKEVCGLHAEAFSSAEFLHGPVAIAGPATPVLVFAQNDRTRPGVDALMSELGSRGVPMITAGANHDQAINLPTPAGHPAIEPMARVLSLYRMINDLALRLGLDPDSPPNLRKVTATV